MMTKCSERIYTKYSDELKKVLLQDNIKFLKVYGDNDTCVEYKRIEHGHLTNADRIRAMTDEELAELVCDHACMLCPIEGCEGRMEEGRKKCKQYWLDWLKQEVDE